MKLRTRSAQARSDPTTTVTVHGTAVSSVVTAGLRCKPRRQLSRDFCGFDEGS
jgi:hypothetical protein